tara:strand:- start:50 stop:319 length:270 start_codon:yes stop_codon:yes gene_type:complete
LNKRVPITKYYTFVFILIFFDGANYISPKCIRTEAVPRNNTRRTLPNKGTFISRNHGIIINNMPLETLNPGDPIVKGYIDKFIINIKLL